MDSPAHDALVRPNFAYDDARFRAVFEYAPIGLATADLTGKLTSVNRRLCEFIGYTHDELCGRSYVDLSSDHDRHLSIAALERFKAGYRGAIEYEKRYIRKDGTIVWASIVVCALDQPGGEPIVIAHVHDDTARRQVEQGRDRLGSVLEETPDFVAIVDTSFRIIFLNRKARQVLGPEMLGQDALDMHSAVPRAHVQHAFSSAIRDGVWKGESVIKNRKGEAIPISLLCIAHRDSEGKLQFISTLARNISDLVAAERQRQVLLQKLLTAEAEERRRLARELHDEVGQALTSQLLYLEVLEQAGCADTKGVEKIRQIATETIENLSHLARGLHPSILDDLGLEAALKRFGESFGRGKRPRVTVQVTGMTSRLPLPVETTAYRLVQEAISNATKHAEATAIEVTVSVEQDRVRVVIEDNGHGFDPKQCSPGLGLVSMRERAELLRGSLRIESGANGTSVIAELPLHE